MQETLTKQEEIREGLKDHRCNRAKSDELFSCSQCEKLELLPVCSIRNDVDEDLAYLHSKGVVIRVDDTTRCDCSSCKDIFSIIDKRYLAVEPLIKEDNNDNKREVSSL